MKNIRVKSSKFLEMEDSHTYKMWKEAIKKIKSDQAVKPGDHYAPVDALYQNVYRHSDKVERDATQLNRFDIHPPQRQSALQWEPTHGRGYFPDQNKARKLKKPAFKDKIYLHQVG